MQPVRNAESDPPVGAGRPTERLTELVKQHHAERERIAELLDGDEPVRERQRQPLDGSVGGPTPTAGRARSAGTTDHEPSPTLAAVRLV